MVSLRRDGLLAVGLLVALVAACLATVGPGPLGQPAAVGLGVCGAVVVEAAFLRYPDTLLAVWECPGVAVASACGLGALAVGTLVVAPWLLAAAVWGLVTYLLLLSCILWGLGNPLAAVVGAGERE